MAPIDEFKVDLQNLAAIEVVRKRIIAGSCAKISDVEYRDLRGEVSSHYGIQFDEVIVVGSAKLGFSIAPHKRYQGFGEESDVDLVIASKELFEVIWKEIYDFDRYGGYWGNRYKEPCKKYIYKGWIRPDMMPSSPGFKICSEWFDYFARISGSGDFGNYKINGALYHSIHFVESYQEKAVELCKREIVEML